MARRSGVDIETSVYEKFKGADFSTDPSLIKPYRSPMCTNMISDEGGMPVKRTGWRTLFSTGAEIHGLWYLAHEGSVHFIAHSGAKLLRWDDDGLGETGEPTELMSGLSNVSGAQSAAAALGGKLWILTGAEYIVYDGATAARVADSAYAYAPTTVISRDPTNGGGESFEDLNLVSRYRVNSFLADGTSTVYHLDADELDAEGAVFVTVDGEEKTEGSDFTVDRTSGTVTFTSAPPAPAAGSADTVTIKFPKTITGEDAKIEKCSIITTYGVGGKNRVCMSGNPDFPNRDWMSGFDEPAYMPDLGYSTIGIEGVAVKGYCRVGEYQAIVKENNGQDSTIFMRSGTLDSEGNAVFSVFPSIAGVGAVSGRSFASLGDEPLFLASTGIHTITNSSLSSDRIAQNRSSYINAKLCIEPGLDRACAVQYRGLYLLAVNSHVYVLDGKQNKSYRSDALNDYVYEGFYWENVPAHCWMNHISDDGEALYFGTLDGRICRFNTDKADMSRYSDDGEAIRAVWATKADDDGDVTLLKTMIKKGNSVTIKPFSRSSAQICFRTESDVVDWQAAYDTMDIFDWEDIDFSRFSFNANDAPQEIMFNTKVKKYKRLQILIRNEAVNEGFGVYNITKHFVYGNYAKR